jgi:ribosomal silencing factor RsfS
MSADDSDRRVLSRKELAKEQRRAAYQKAKERRATDPRYLAMKEAAKEQRRAAYQKAKERRKAAAAEQKTKLKAERARQRTNERAGADEELWKLVTWMTKGSDAES